MNFEPNTTYIFDGAMGTELQRRAYHTTLPLWSAKALFDVPDLVQQIHQDYILAGADIIITDTFRTQRRTLAKAGLAHETERINELAVELAVKARDEVKVDRPIYIAASMTTLEDCYEVDLVPDDLALKREHTDQANIFDNTDIDFFLLETFNTIREVKAAAKAVYETGKPMMISFITNHKGDLLSGETLRDAVAVLDRFEPLAYMVNCISVSKADLALPKLKEATNRPVGVQANGDGHAGSDDGWVFDQTNSQLSEYCQACSRWKELGVQFIGGCCGTNPEYTQAYSALK